MDLSLWDLHLAGWMAFIPFGLMAICLVLLLRYLFRGPHRLLKSGEFRKLEADACAILNRQYAHGEIGKKQYDELKRTICGRNSLAASRAANPGGTARRPDFGIKQEDRAVGV